MNSWTKVLRIPRTSPILFRSVQLPKKFGWKFWILILQKSWKKLALKFDKNYAEKYFSQNKIEKINAWKICSWKSSNWKNLLFNNEKKRKTIWKATENTFLKMKMENFWHFNPEILTNFREKIFENCWKTENWRCTLHCIGKMRAWSLRWNFKIYFRRCFSYCFFS